MCGIAGVYKFRHGEVTEREVVVMRDAIHYRGPDGAGSYISPDKKVGLGHRRLAIIDLSALGAQPMTDAAEKIWITFNGEIYNFKSLREDLIKKGYTFRSKSDTEVIIYGYKEYGPDFVKRMNGMFAFVIWDDGKKRLFAARDHLGVKPLYYSIQNGTFYFGSEIKAILAHPNFKKECAEEQVATYLTFSCIPAPHTLFRDVAKLPPAHYLTLSASGELHLVEYWNPLSNENHYSKKESESYYAKEIRTILEDSINMQMVSDVPFGCFLSGGMDSSINAALMSKALGAPVETFSIGSNEFPQYNEFDYSRKVAKLLGANTHEQIVGHQDLVDFLPNYAFHADDPNGDQINFMVYYLSKLIHESGVVVAQVGEGADELFAGYPQYLRALRYESTASHIPKAMMNLAHGSARALAPTHPMTEQLRRSKEGIASFWGTAIAFAGAQKDKLLSHEFASRIEKNADYRIIEHYYKEAKQHEPESDLLEQMTYMELKIRLGEFLLMRVDKMGMAHSIEARVPFLDHRLVELALHIPQELKLKHNITKYMLKHAVKGIIPDEIIKRKKQGFGAPLQEWLRNKKLAQPFVDVIHNSKLKDRNLINYDFVDEIIGAHQKGLVNNTFRIWNLVTLSLWYDRWFD